MPSDPLSVTALFYQELEPRIVFDGAMVATGEMILVDDNLAEAGTDAPPATNSQYSTELEAAADELETILAGYLEEPNTSAQIVFIDSAVEDIDTLVASIDPAFEVFVLDMSSDGVEQIADILSNRTDINAIHIISHGSQGELKLGTGVLSIDAMEGKYADELATIGAALSVNGDILIYGCDFGEGELGREAANRLAQLTGADIAVSDDLTGNENMGGDWELEYKTGVIESEISLDFDALENWDHTLAAAVDSTSTGSATDQDNVTFSHTTSGTERLLLVAVSMEPEDESVSSITYNGKNLYLVGVEENPDESARVEIWALVAPDEGTHDIIVNLTDDEHQGVSVGAMTFTGVDQLNPLSGFSGNSGNSTDASTTVNSATGSLVFGVVQSHMGSAVTPGAGQTEYWDITSDHSNGGGTTQAGAVSVTTSWTVKNDSWSVAAVSVNSVSNSAPVGIPAITGIVTEDQTLGADISGISDADGLGTFTYQWLRDGVAITGATSSTYVLGDSDVGTQISVAVSYTDDNGTDEGPLTSVQTAAVANVNDVPVGIPAITGIATEDQTLGADISGISDADGLGTFAYQWLRDGVAITGATSSTYVLGDSDVGTKISVAVSYTDDNGTSEGPLTSVQTAAVANVNDNPVGIPAITGIATEDQTLTADISGISDADGLGTFAYQWLRDGVVITGATASTYILGDADVGTKISVAVSYTDDNGTNEGPLTSAQTTTVVNVNDNPVGIPAITGIVTEDQTLTADTSGISDADGLGTFAYQWLRDGIVITGATASTYILGDADVGTQISVAVSYTDDNGTNEGPLTSVQTTTVVDVNDAPVGIPAITGIVTEDQTLTVDTSGISDADGLGTFAYQWLRDGILITGATASTYILGDADVGTQISVSVSYTDGNGSNEGPLTSVQTAAVANINDNPVITSGSGGETVFVEINENTNDVITLTSSDIDGGTPVYSIAGGSEAPFFTIDPVSGELNFITYPDFEFPGDSGGINQYDVIVQVSDGFGGVDTQTVSVIVLNVDEPVAIAPEPPLPPIVEIDVEPPEEIVEEISDPLDLETTEEEATIIGSIISETELINEANEPAIEQSDEQFKQSENIGSDQQVVNNNVAEDARVVNIKLAEPAQIIAEPKPVNFDIGNIDHKAFTGAMDASLSDMKNYDKVLGATPIEVSLGLGSLVTAGYVAWILRSGALLSALLTSMPAWGRFDPIVVLVSRTSKQKDKPQTENPMAKAERVFDKATELSQ